MCVRKSPYYTSSGHAVFNSIINLNIRAGKKLKAVHFISRALNDIYALFYTFNTELCADYPAYKIFFEYSETFADEFYKPDFLFKYVYNYLELVFLIKKIRSRRKKKKQVQVKLKISYLPRRQRRSITIRLISAYLKNYNLQNNASRFSNGLLYLVLSGKNSFLYKKKLSLYNKLLEKKKFY